MRSTNETMVKWWGSMALAAAAVFVVNTAARAEEIDMAKMYTVKSVHVQEVREVRSATRAKPGQPMLPDALGGEGFAPLDEPAPGAGDPGAGGDGSGGGLLGDLNVADLALDKIINMGKKIWAIVEANRPVVNVTENTANALPEGAQNWVQLQGWRAPIARTYEVTYENLYGMNVVDFKFRVMYTPGGNVGGKGRYLANVTIVPADLSVFWGYKFNANVTVPSVTNAGTTQDPVAGASLQLQWTIDTVLKHEESTENFYVQGDGAFQDLGDGS